MKRQEKEARRVAVVDPEVTRDVLTNLQNLLDADDLLKVAGKLRTRPGGRRVDCYQLISTLSRQPLRRDGRQGLQRDGRRRSHRCRGHKRRGLASEEPVTASVIGKKARRSRTS